MIQGREMHDIIKVAKKNKNVSFLFYLENQLIGTSESGINDIGRLNFLTFLRLASEIKRHSLAKNNGEIDEDTNKTVLISVRH